MKNSILVLSFISLLITSCSDKKAPQLLSEVLDGSPSIAGKESYLNSPYVTAGDRLYMVGHQDGSFPEIGWHVKGEMGGIWNHPIKLMDGLELSLTEGDEQFALEKAHSFVNYPFANEHYYDVPDSALQLSRIQFVPDGHEGIIIEYQFQNNSPNARNLELTFTGHADLRPVWLGERTGMIDSQDEGKFNKALGAWVFKDKNNPWFLIFGADFTPTSHLPEESKYAGMGSAGSLMYPLEIPAGSISSITFTIAGSYTSQDGAIETYKTLRQNKISLLEAKKERYQRLAANSKLTIPDARLQETFAWLKYNCDWLVRTVPEIGTGISAGIPDYPWWFGVDSEYALRGYMAIGQTDVVHKTIELLDSVSNAVNGNGRIIHEMSTNGTVFNPGNINETPQYASLIWEIYRWNGDEEFLKKYYPRVKKGLAWLMEANDENQNLFPDGFGMMEIHGLDSEMIDVAAYTQRAFEDAAKMATVLGEEAQAANYQELATALKIKINEEFWSEEFNSFADFIGTDQQALHLIDDAIIRADTLDKPWAVEELNQTAKKIRANPSNEPRPFVLHHNWVVNTPMEMKIADEEKAVKALNTANTFVNPFGVFVTGIDRDASAGSDDGSFQGSKVFSYTGAVMTLPTGVQAVAENNYGRPDQALNYLNRMVRTFSYALPGSMYEVSPDYGMITQAWNIYAFAVPIVQQFFGIQPYAAEKKIVVQPQMPSVWDNASLENVKVGDNTVSVTYSKNEGVTRIRVWQEKPGWTLELRQDKRKGFDYNATGDVQVVKSDAQTMIYTTERSEIILEITPN